MSKKQAVILFLVAIFIGFLLLVPFNYICKITNWCTPISLSYHLPKKIGKENFDIIFETKNELEKVEFKAMTRSIISKTGENITVEFHLKNQGKQNLRFRPRRYIVPAKAQKYIEFYNCLCFKEQFVKSGEGKKLPLRFRINPAIENDEFFKHQKFIRIGYELFEI